MNTKKLSIGLLSVLCVISMFVWLYGCTEPQRENNNTYGEICFFTDNSSFFGENARNYHPDNGPILGLYPFQPQTFGMVRDVSEIETGITYVVDEYSSVENAVVTTKWVYYASLFSMLKERDSRNTLDITDTAIVDRVLSDNYCMEKFHMDIYSYVFDDPDSPYYGKTYREVYVENGGDLSCPSNITLLCLPVSWYIGDENYYLYINATYGLRIAAMQRYGVIDVNKLEKEIGQLKVGAFRTSFYGADGNETSFTSCNTHLNVVGYIETEADKLLSTGVSMDKNSEEYKIVMQQLQNPVFYSVCGNFLEE